MTTTTVRPYALCICYLQRARNDQYLDFSQFPSVFANTNPKGEFAIRNCKSRFVTAFIYAERSFITRKPHSTKGNKTELYFLSIPQGYRVYQGF